MAVSEGFGEFTGRVGNLIYYKVGGQLRVRKMPEKGFSNKVRKGRAFDQFRQYSTIFSKSSSFGKLIREGLADRKAEFFDKDTHHRLNALIQEAIKLDDEPLLKKKELLPRNAGLLAGFQFCKGSGISNYFSDVEMQHENGEHVLKVAFVREEVLQQFSNAQVSVLILAFDPLKTQCHLIGESSQMYDLVSVKEGITLPVPNVLLETGVIYFVLLQVEPYTMINNVPMRMYEKSYQCLQVIDVMFVKDL